MITLLKLICAFLLSTQVAYGQKERNSDLMVQGIISRIEVIPGYQNYVRLRVDLELAFINKGAVPLIILKPGEDLPAQMYWQGGQSLALTNKPKKAPHFQ
jgi:hypothetical protein